MTSSQVLMENIKYQPQSISIKKKIATKDNYARFKKFIDNTRANSNNKKLWIYSLKNKKKLIETDLLLGGFYDKKFEHFSKKFTANKNQSLIQDNQFYKTEIYTNIIKYLFTVNKDLFFNNDIKILTNLIKLNPDIINSQNKRGYTPLMDVVIAAGCESRANNAKILESSMKGYDLLAEEIEGNELKFDKEFGDVSTAANSEISSCDSNHEEDFELENNNEASNKVTATEEKILSEIDNDTEIIQNEDESEQCKQTQDLKTK